MPNHATGKNGKNPIKKIGVGRNGNLTPGNPGNSGGKKGRSGRKTLEFKAECDRLADSEVLPRMESYLTTKDPNDQAWRWCADKVLEYSKSKAPQTTKHTGPNGEPLQGTQVHVHLGDNGRGLAPPARIGNGNGTG